MNPNSCFVERAAHAEPAAIQDVRVDHGGAHAVVAEQFLDRADVVAAAEQMGGELCRSVWHVAGFAIPAFATASFIDRCTAVSCR
jgi:hypothetical protein